MRLDGFEGGGAIKALADVDIGPASALDMSIHGGLEIDKITVNVNNTGSNLLANHGVAGKIR